MSANHDERTADIQTGTTVTPMGGSDRLVLIDSLRGLAIFGILVINIGYLAWPKVHNWPIFPVSYASTPDLVTDLLVRFFAKGKFNVIFSFLFGLGMAIQLERFQRSNRTFTPFFLKRVWWLFVIGALHGLFIWNGDILMVYALIGFILVWFQKLQVRGLTICILLLCLVPAGLYGSPILSFLAQEETSAGLYEIYRSQASGEAWALKTYDEVLAVYLNGSWLEVARLRATEVWQGLMALPYWGTNVLISFLFGVLAWRMDLFRTPRKRLMMRILIWGALIGVITNLAMIAILHLRLPGAIKTAVIAAWDFGRYPMGFSYLAGLTLLWHAGRCRAFFATLAPVGRMALTNYITHSIIFTLIFNGYGLGMMGKIGQTTAFLMVLAMIAFQIFFSRWWLARFRFGPLEAIWRRLSYGRANARTEPLTQENVADRQGAEVPPARPDSVSP